MKNYNLIPQEENNFCGCSVIQAILNKYDIKVSQKEIAQELYPSSQGFYFNDSKFKEFISKKGFNYEFYWYNETPFNEPDFLLSENLEKDILFGWKNHIRLVISFKDPNIEFIDPKNGEKQTKDLKEILKEMRENNDGFFGLIKKLN